ncbi:hypothetical protein BH11PAT3_BH11PAT3_2070 [soil metagenome]
MNWKYTGTYHPSRALKIIQIVLLVLIVIGIGLLATQKIWVPRLVQYLLKDDQVSIIEPVIPVQPIPKPIQKPTSLPVPKVMDGSVKGIVTIGPTCPVVREPADPNCADKPYKTTLVLSNTIIGRNGGMLVFTDENGVFTRTLSPGTYMIRSQNDAVYPRLTPVTFEVVQSKQTILNLQFDSGIR